MTHVAVLASLLATGTKRYRAWCLAGDWAGEQWPTLALANLEAHHQHRACAKR